MAESTALVPVPFHAPVRTGIGAYFKFRETSKPPLLLDQQVAAITPDGDEAMAYRRDGGLSADPHMGTLVNIYV